MYGKFVSLVALSLMCWSGNVKCQDIEASSTAKVEIILPEILAVSGNPSVVYGKGFPGTVTRTIRSNDKSAFFYASVRIINPKKSKYSIQLECVDEAGNVVIEGILHKELFPMYRKQYMGGEIGQIEVNLALNPTVGATVPNQRAALKDDTQYFIRMFVDGRLISITNFRYLVL